MFDITLCKDYTGISSYISLDALGKIKLEVSKHPSEYVVSTTEYYENNLIDLFPSIGLELAHFVDEGLRKSYHSIYGDDVSWLRALGKRKFVLDIDRHLKHLKKLISEYDERSYFKTLVASREILGKLQSASVDRKMLATERQNRDSATLCSLQPIDYEDCEVVRYNHGSQTGRLVVKNGPRILTLHKEDRKIFKPSKEGHVLAQVDFVSLEPRVAYLLTRDSSPRDIYKEMGEATKSSASRASLKIATLSTLYGSSKVDQQLTRSVSKFFAVDKIKEQRLSEERLFNLYGRPLNPEEEWLRLSHYVQSTAVDIALLGFSKFVNQWEMKPLFLIHDALVFECEKEIYDAMASSDLFVDVEPLGRFYLGLSEFGKDN